MRLAFSRRTQLAAFVVVFTLLLVGLLSTYGRNLSVAEKIRRRVDSVEGYAAVLHKLEQWWRPDLRPTPSNPKNSGCTAFLSTVLRMADVEIPTMISPDVTYDDLVAIRSPSLLVDEFVNYLTSKLGWSVSNSFDDLQYGDVIITRFPWEKEKFDHATLFLEWVDRNSGIVLVLDNQGYRHSRPLVPPKDSEFSPFAIALRPAS